MNKLTAAEIKCLVKSKGWQLQEIAAIWGMTKNSMSRIVNNPDRKQLYDDAFNGIAHKSNKKDDA